jgi:peptide/nickel transport system permease protein
MTVTAPRTLRAPAHYFLRSALNAFNTNKTSWVGLVMFSLVALAALLAPLLAPHNPIEQNVLAKLRPPTSNHLLGTDSFGRDILSRLLYGARVSLVIGFIATLAAMAIGSAIGLFAGWYGSRFDALVMQASTYSA